MSHGLSEPAHPELARSPSALLANPPAQDDDDDEISSEFVENDVDIIAEYPDETTTEGHAAVPPGGPHRAGASVVDVEKAMPPIVRTLVEQACAYVRRESTSPTGVSSHTSPPPTGVQRFSPSLEVTLKTLGKLACTSRSCRDAVRADSVDIALTRAISSDPPAWRGWSEGLTPDSLEALRGVDQVLGFLHQEDEAFSVLRRCAVAHRLPDAHSRITLNKHGKFLRPTIAFPNKSAVEDPAANILPLTKVGGYPDWPFHDEALCPEPPPKSRMKFVAQVNLAHAAGLVANPNNDNALLPSFGMLYFFVSRDALDDIDNYDDHLKPIGVDKCSVVYYPGSTAEWPRTSHSESSNHASSSPAISTMTADQKRKFAVPEPSSYGTSTRATTALMPPPTPFRNTINESFHSMFNAMMAGVDIDDDDAAMNFAEREARERQQRDGVFGGGGLPSDLFPPGVDFGALAQAFGILGSMDHVTPPAEETATVQNEIYAEYASGAGPLPSREFPLMLGNCAPPSWIYALDVRASPHFLPGVILDKIVNAVGRTHDGMPLLQLNNLRGPSGRDYLVFTAGKADLLARDFTRVRAFVLSAKGLERFCS